MEEVRIGGAVVHRSKGWALGYWTNSDRAPREQGITDAWYHVLDASWTALMMLRWNEEIAPNPRLVAYASVTLIDRATALRTIRLVFEDGSSKSVKLEGGRPVTIALDAK